MFVRRAIPVMMLALVLSAQQARTPARLRPTRAKAAVARTAHDPSLTTARTMLSAMTLRDRVAQLVIGVANGDVYAKKSKEYVKVHHWVRDLHIGGLIINNETEYGVARHANPQAMVVFLNQMQRLARVPLIIGSDFERAASMRVSGGAEFPHSMAIAAGGDLEASRYEGLVTAREARALGVHWVFAPVADVNNNPKNPVINIRSYGEDPQVVSEHVAAFIEGAHSDPNAKVLVTAKHFPGHGDTDVDSHLGLARLPATRDRIEMTELVPFRVAIAHGVDSIMTAHMAVPEIDDSGVPATVSHKVLTDLLRDELKFRGIIVTDAMTMQGLTDMFNNGEASVRSLEAGADVLLMPPDPDQAIRAVLEAIKTGRLTKERVNESALRVLSAKLRLGIFKNKLVDVNGIAEVLGDPQANQRVQQIADRGVTLLRNEGHVVPVAANSRPCLIVINSLRHSVQGQRLVREFRARAKDGHDVVIDTGMPYASMEAAVDDTSKCTSIVAASFASMTAKMENANRLIQKLSEGPVPVVAMSFNDPYWGSQLPKAAAYLTPFSSTTPSEIAAAKALFGNIDITGHTPVSIPEVATLGAGIVTSSPVHLAEAGPSSDVVR